MIGMKMGNDHGIKFVFGYPQLQELSAAAFAAIKEILFPLVFHQQGGEVFFQRGQPRPGT
ncbi:hypothetical protein DSECCO2_664730 [anaerobic digester metagenome]